MSTNTILFSNSGQMGPGAMIMSAAGLVTLTYLMQGILHTKKFSSSVQSDSEFTSLASSVQNVLNLTKCEGLFKGPNGADAMWNLSATPIDLNSCQPGDQNCTPSNTTQKYNAQISSINAIKSGAPIVQEGQKLGQLSILKIALTEVRGESDPAPVAVVDPKDGKNKKTYNAKLQLIGRKGEVPRLKEYYLSIVTEASPDASATQEKISSCGGNLTAEARAIASESIFAGCTQPRPAPSQGMVLVSNSSGCPNWENAKDALSTTSIAYAPGTFSWTAPAGVTSVSIQAWAAGGAGGEGDSGNGQGGAGGGGSGSYAEGDLVVQPGITYSIVVGAAGVANGGGFKQNGGGGGKTLFGNFITLSGGGGGSGSWNPPAGIAGIGSIAAAVTTVRVIDGNKGQAQGEGGIDVRMGGTGGAPNLGVGGTGGWGGCTTSQSPGAGGGGGSDNNYYGCNGSPGKLILTYKGANVLGKIPVYMCNGNLSVSSTYQGNCYTTRWGAQICTTLGCTKVGSIVSD